MAFQRNKKETKTEVQYSETNRLTLFYNKNSNHPSAPTHNGYIVFTEDMISDYEADTDGTVRYRIDITAWLKDENGHINGVLKNSDDEAEKRAAYLEEQAAEEKTKTKGGKKGYGKK